MATEIPIRPSDTIVLDVEYTNRTQVKTVVVGTPVRSIQAGGSNINLAADSGTDTFTVGAGQTLTFSGTDPVQTLATDNDIAISVDNATNTSTGIAKFDSDHFTVGGDGNVRLIAFDSNGENTGSLIPNTDSAYDLGSPTNKWRKLYISGQTISLGTINLQDEGGVFAAKDSSGNPAKISLDANTTDDLPQGITNIFYSRALFDSALNEGFEDNQILNIGTDNDLQIYHDAGNFRTILNNSGFGDLRIQSNNVRLMGAAGTETLLHGTTGGSVDIYYNASKKLETNNYGVAVTGKLNADSGEITNLEVSSLIVSDGSFTDIQTESITVSGDSNSVSNLDATNINGNLYVSGNLTIDGTTTTVNSITVSINDKNLVLADSAADLTSLDGAGITMGGQFITTPPEMKYQTTGNLINFNRSVDVTGAVTADSATFTNITRSGSTSYAGTWGSATLIPVVTLDASGFIDSIGTVSVAAVSSTSWDSSTAQLVINTTDGGIFRTTINGFGDEQRLYFGDANEASIRHTTDDVTVIEAGATELDLDGAGHFLIKNNVGGAKIAEFTPFAGVDLYYGSAKKLETASTGITVTGTLNADSATVTNLTADSAVVTDISGTSANYSSVNATTGTISQLDVDSAHIGIIDNNTLNTNALIADSANITNVSGSSANYSTGNFTTLTAAGLTVNGDITGTGNTYIAGNLTVQGTTTTVNSTEVTINDKNIVLADSAVNNVDIDGGGFTLGGALYTGGTKPTITYTLTNDRWALNKALNVSGSITADSATVTNLTADSASITNISGTSANYSTVNATTGTISQLSADSAHIGIIDNNILRSGTGTISQFDADSAHISALNTDTLTRSNTTVTAGTYGSGTSIPVVTVNASGFVDSIGSVIAPAVSSTSWDSSTGQFTINTSDGSSYTTAIKGFGDNQALTFGDDGDLTIKHDADNFRTVINNAGFGDLRIQSNNVRLMGAAGTETLLHGTTAGSVDIYWDNSKKLETTTYGATVTGTLNADSSTVTNLTADSATIGTLNSTDFVSTNITRTNTTVAAGTYGTSSTIPVITVNASGFVDSIGTIVSDAAGIDSVSWDSATTTYTINFGGTPYNQIINGFSNLQADSAHIQTLNTHTLSRSNTTVIAGAYGSASLVPVVTVDASGFVDSIGTVSVAGVSSVAWDSATTTYTISTADGGSYSQIINGFSNLQADSASITNVSGTSANYSTVNATTGTISQLDVDSAHIQTLNTHTLTRSNTTVTAGVYGSASLVPIITIDASGFVDSIGAASVAGVSSTSWDSATTAFTVSTADGGSYSTTINGFSNLQADSASITNVSGTSANYSTINATTLTSTTATISGNATVTGGILTTDSAVVDGINFNITPTQHSTTAGSLYFDSDEQRGLTVTVRTRENPNPGVRMNLGQEAMVYVHNLTGAQINQGQVVYVSGTAHGAHPQVSLSKADTSVTSKVAGIANMDIPDGAHGWVTRYGIVRGLNTGGLSEGTSVYVSKDSAGEWTTTEVTVDDGYPFHVGQILAADSTNGSILVDPFTENYEYLRIEDRLKVTGKIEGESAELSQVDFNTSYTEHIPFREGALWYDNIHKTLNFWGDDSAVVHELGIEEHQRVYNNTGSLIQKGKPLYYSGNYNPGGGVPAVPTVGLADATDVNAYNAQGLAAGDIAAGSYGYVILSGLVEDVDTSSLSAGQNFFVGLGPGLVQNESPLYPNFPMCLGWVVKSDASTGTLLVNQQNHSVNSFRVRTSAHIGADLQVDGNLTVLGTQTTVGQSNVTQGAPFYRLNEGDAIGEAGTVFTGGGLDDAFFAGHFTGTSPQTYYVRIDGVGTGPAGVDTFEVALGNDSEFTAPVLTKTPITGDPQLIHSADNISVEFGSTVGHDSGDRWSGTASPINVDTGFFTNRNTGTSGVGYTHMGFYFDVSDEKWKVLDEYDSTPTGTINVTDSSLGILVASSFEGNLTGAVTGNASTATNLATGRDFSLTGDITASAVSFNGSGDVVLTTAYNPGSIVNADINASAAIVDTKLATISTAGKVQNSATTATATNTGSAIVTRDPSGNFAAGTITADFDRSANTTVIAGTYGSASEVPVFTVDASGFIDSIGVVNVAGVSATAYDSSTGIFTISTADGSSFNTTFHDSADQESRARYAISVTDNGGDGSLSYDASTGVISYTGPSASEVRAHFSAGTGIGLASGVISTNDAQIVHDNLSGFEANEHINHTSVSITAGTGLVGGGDISATRDLRIDSAEFLAYFESSINHDNLTGFVGNEHIDHTGVSITAGVGLTGGGDISSTRDLSIDSAELNAYFGGTGKGFDADTLDGQEGTYYRINVYDAAGSLLN